MVKNTCLFMGLLVTSIFMMGPHSVASAGTESALAPSLHLDRSEAEALLRDAARAGDIEIVAGLAKAGVSLEAADAKGYTPLILASYHGQLALVEWLLSQKVDPCRGDARGNTALMGAAFKGHEALVTLLLAQKCPVDQANAVGQTALMFSALMGNKAASLLLKQGASTEKRDDSGKTAAEWAETQGVTLPVPSPGF